MDERVGDAATGQSVAGGAQPRDRGRPPAERLRGQARAEVADVGEARELVVQPHEAPVGRAGALKPVRGPGPRPLQVGEADEAVRPRLRGLGAEHVHAEVAHQQPVLAGVNRDHLRDPGGRRSGECGGDRRLVREDPGGALQEARPGGRRGPQDDGERPLVDDLGGSRRRRARRGHPVEHPGARPREPSRPCPRGAHQRRLGLAVAAAVEPPVERVADPVVERSTKSGGRRPSQAVGRDERLRLRLEDRERRAPLRIEGAVHDPHRRDPAADRLAGEPDERAHQQLVVNRREDLGEARPGSAWPVAHEHVVAARTGEQDHDSSAR